MKLKDIETAISDCLGEFYDALAVTNKVALTKRDRNFIRGTRKHIESLKYQLDEIDTILDIRLRRSMNGIEPVPGNGFKDAERRKPS